VWLAATSGFSLGWGEKRKDVDPRSKRAAANLMRPEMNELGRHNLANLLDYFEHSLRSLRAACSRRRALSPLPACPAWGAHPAARWAAVAPAATAGAASF